MRKQETREEMTERQSREARDYWTARDEAEERLCYKRLKGIDEIQLDERQLRIRKKYEEKT